MKFRGLVPIGCLFFLSVMGIPGCCAQEDPSEDPVKLKTVMENYAPDLVVPVEERRRLRSERYWTVRHRRAVIDTLDISDRKKKKLLRELYNTPFTDEYDKVLGTLQPEDPLSERPD